MADSQTTLIRVMALHALAYCERLYYLEEVEEIRASDHRVYAWESDLLQVIAYVALLEEHLGKSIKEGRVRYHANNKTVRIPITEESYAQLKTAIGRARELATTVQRPPVVGNTLPDWRRQVACNVGIGSLKTCATLQIRPLHQLGRTISPVAPALTPRRASI